VRNYVIRSLLSGVLLLLFLTLVIFILVRVVPGDPALGILVAKSGGERGIDPAKLAALREELGLNRPLHVQYLSWLWDTVRGDLGTAVTWHKSVASEIKKRFAVTLQISVFSLLMILVMSMVMGTLAAVHQGSLLDNIIRLLAVSGMALPNFLIGTLVVYFLVIGLDWFPPVGNFAIWSDPWDALRQIIWPSLALAIYFSAVLTRLVRNTMLEALREDYIRTARAKGLSERAVTIGHALRNVLAPNVTMYSLLALNLLGGSVIIESIFNIRGIGKGFVDALLFRDYAYIQATLLFFGGIVLLINLATDLSYGFLDPRVRRE
jgi:peptide/nickel transport system permease protein